MSKIVLLGIGGGSGGSADEVSALRNQALESAITYFNDGGDEPVNGTMRDFSSTPTRTLSSVTVSATGIASGKLKEGTSTTTEEGYYTHTTSFQMDIGTLPQEALENFGDAVAGAVLKGQTFTSAAGYKVSGTIETYNGEISDN